jgi:uncharacterized protein (TIGR03435 family)
MTAAAMRAILLAVAALSAHAQSGKAPPPAFEVASIKPADPKANGMSSSWSKGRLTMDNISLKDLIEQAFVLKDYMLSGPSWLDSVHFNVAAKPPAGASMEGFPEMMQTMLADRFKLEYHRESKVLPAYVLTVDKKGLKLKPVEDKGGGGWSTNRGKIDGNELSMAGIADLLSHQLNSPVEDMTGVSGRYDIKLLYIPDDSPADVKFSPGAASSIYAALQEQAGLKLETKKVPVSIVVVDRIERTPTEN